MFLVGDCGRLWLAYASVRRRPILLDWFGLEWTRMVGISMYYSSALNGLDWIEIVGQGWFDWKGLVQKCLERL